MASPTKGNIYRRYRPTFAVTPKIPVSTPESIRNISMKYPTRKTFQSITTPLPKIEQFTADQILLPPNLQSDDEYDAGITATANYNTGIRNIQVSTTTRTKATLTVLPLSTRKIILKTNSPSTFSATIPTRQSFSASEIMEYIPEHSKVLIHSSGTIQCLDQGNFPHPVSCKKFISCAKMETGKVVGWEYTCPKHLSFDPVGGMCNWSADLGCDEM